MVPPSDACKSGETGCDDPGLEESRRSMGDGAGDCTMAARSAFGAIGVEGELGGRRDAARAARSAAACVAPAELSEGAGLTASAALLTSVRGGEHGVAAVSGARRPTGAVGERDRGAALAASSGASAGKGRVADWLRVVLARIDAVEPQRNAVWILEAVAPPSEEATAPSLLATPRPSLLACDLTLAFPLGATSVAAAAPPTCMSDDDAAERSAADELDVIALPSWKSSPASDGLTAPPCT
mmetsp:Transcript_42631/g.112219  ORF Transcript_42631/g.112219 Transcript_42631/m.112219 type:complete len:241 (+) Transcript_42631:757-1479(+)